ncbi:MAG: hypothetical protein M3410_07505 [Acidobacteriota bacterium]|nr:hypothetical protein [Acidobacteriota bacterium]
MNEKTRKLIEKFVHDDIDSFHPSRIQNIKALTLNQVLKNRHSPVTPGDAQTLT